MPKVRVNDIEVYYEIYGKGTPLIHIGGLAGDARTWMRQIEHLSQQYQVLCFDNRGTGRTDCPDRRYWRQDFADRGTTTAQETADPRAKRVSRHASEMIGEVITKTF